MTAADIWNYSVPFINAIGPAVFVLAIVANARALIYMFYDMIHGARDDSGWDD